MAKPEVERLLRWRAEPDLFVREALKAEPEVWQADTLRDIPGHDKHSIRSGHGVGKSTLLCWLILWFLTTHANAKVPVTAPTAHQLEDVLWSELRKWLGRMPEALRAQFEFKSN